MINDWIMKRITIVGGNIVRCSLEQLRNVEPLLLKEKFLGIILIFEPFDAMRSMILIIHTVNLSWESLSFASYGNLAPCKHMFINAKLLIYKDLLSVYRDGHGIRSIFDQKCRKLLNDIENENDSHWYLGLAEIWKWGRLKIALSTSRNREKPREIAPYSCQHIDIIDISLPNRGWLKNSGYIGEIL